MLDAIPSPQVIEAARLNHDDRERFGLDHRARADMLQGALDQTCAYARQLWDCLAQMRQYLYDSLPAEHSASHPALAPAADDEAAWDRWQDAFAAVTSTLCGPHGDNGFGRSSAEQLAQSHRG